MQNTYKRKKLQQRSLTVPYCIYDAAYKAAASRVNCVSKPGFLHDCGFFPAYLYIVPIRKMI